MICLSVMDVSKNRASWFVVIYNFNCSCMFFHLLGGFVLFSEGFFNSFSMVECDGYILAGAF